MKCPECGADCWRNEVHNGVCLIHDEWKCEQCEWSEDDGYPMNEVDWQKFNYEFEQSLEKGKV